MTGHDKLIWRSVMKEFAMECDVCQEKFWFKHGERTSGWLVETETPDGEVVTHCRGCTPTEVA